MKSASTNIKFKPTAFESLPLGAVKPAGWLYNQLRIQADGLSGHLDEQWADVGPRNGWIGGDGESWERGPYYLDGLLPLAYLLDDEKLIAKANRWVEWSLNSQRESGLFGPMNLVSANADMQHSHDWWHYMIMLKVMTQFAEATGDERVVPFMTKFFGYVRDTIESMPLAEWAKARGAEMLLSIHWLYGRTGDPALLELAGIIGEQTTDWTGLFTNFPFWNKIEHWDHRSHVVNVAMGVKAPGVQFMSSGEEKEREAVYSGIKSLMTYHGQAHGMFSGDEWLSGTHPSQGVELCAVVEYMFSMENLVRIFGDGYFGDILEKVAYNALPATISADWTSHQYDQQVNQVVCNIAHRNWSNGEEANLFGLDPNFGCCTSNMHQGWPKLASHLWMKDGEGLAAVAYAPCVVRSSVGSGANVTLTVDTEYPFRDTIGITVQLDRTASFPVSLRIPAWCASPVLQVNGQSLSTAATKQYIRIERQWQDGDVITLVLPMEAHTVHRNNAAVSVERGPLVYVLPIEENWQLVKERDMFHDYEVFPASQWKFGIIEGADYEVAESPLPRQPFVAGEAPVRLKTQGRFVRNWRMKGESADFPPFNPLADGPVTELLLVPYGSARLRIGEFPVILGSK
ncbi:beta-L-arabinofuranosidase domain-containing protein [Paenibacillus mendelii]|uniref:Beta-L-arabinofuranosidase domain-containing protein n=1 Tax=Paenibacillus mendelii TaxID=206163 RepID=A0ABV6J4R8_9BACL|nr:beta-L-arabinofuranosidase domain-containing protein [Paenibacillus mendelii]MCQ6560421.1 glycoside hydrolase family 127 protein [Paenibacillus mendelii]